MLFPFILDGLIMAFFRFSNGSPLTRESFVTKVRDALLVAGIENPSQYAYLLYLQIPRERLAALSKLLSVSCDL